MLVLFVISCRISWWSLSREILLFTRYYRILKFFMCNKCNFGKYRTASTVEYVQQVFARLFPSLPTIRLVTNNFPGKRRFRTRYFTTLTCRILGGKGAKFSIFRKISPPTLLYFDPFLTNNFYIAISGALK